MFPSIEGKHMGKSEGKKCLLNFLRLSKLPRYMACVDINLSKSGSELQLEYGTEISWGEGVETLSRKIPNIYSGYDPVGAHKVLSPFSIFSQIKKCEYIIFMMKNYIPVQKAPWKQNGREAGPSKPPIR